MSTASALPRLLLPLALPVALVAGCQLFGSGSSNAPGSGPSAGQILGAGQTLSCPELASGGSVIGAKFDANAQISLKVAAFVQAAKDLKAVAGKVEVEVEGACKKMGADLGMTPAELAAVDGPAGGAKGACAALSAKIDGILSGGIKVEASYDPPKCEVNVSAKASCDASCKVEVDPGEIVAKCEPAKLSGTCEGTCKGSCGGTCNGKCSGECSAKDAQGNCVGTCDGECQGSCSGECHARCEGTWKAPKCEGHVTPPSVDADCQASCKARAEITSECTKPKLELKASQSTALVGKLLASAAVHVPALIVAQVKLGRQAAADIKVLVRLGNELSGRLEGAGGKAIACVSAAASAVVQASASINVSVQASASVSGKVGASI